MENPRIDWHGQDSVLLLNPRWPEAIQIFFRGHFKNWLNDNPNQSLVFIPTSGTTAKDLRGTKIVVLTKEALLNSAKSVGAYFNFSSQDRVAQTLPIFHVGGLSQGARSFAWGQKSFLYSEKWDPAIFVNFLNQNRITHTSLVPTQLFDLVQAGLKSPISLACLFLGGGVVGTELKNAAKKLGWNLIPTYGSTETSSMVAVLGEKGYKALPHAELKISAEGFLQIKASSLLKFYWHCQENSCSFENVVQDGWYTTQDLGRQIDAEFEILGRGSEYAKISGEGVYLSRLQLLLQDCLVALSKPNEVVLGFVASERRGHEVHAFSTLNQADLEPVMSCYNEKVLPFERIQRFHQVQEIPRTDLGKVKWQELK